jgi:hypothetical protein
LKPIDLTLDGGLARRASYSGNSKSEDLVMKSRILTVTAAALVMCSVSLPVLAHHSFAAEFDGQKRVTLTGVITQVK